MEINLRDLRVTLQTSRVALYAGIDLDFPSGSVSAISGPNGVGKSTLLRVICGLKIPGTTNALSALQFSKSYPRYIAYVAQDYTSSLFPWMTVDANIAVPLVTMNKLRGEAIHQRVEELKQQFGCAFGNHLPDQISGGQRQVTALLRAIVRTPDAILMDEPFSALDTYGGTEFRESYMSYLRDHSITTIFISHRLWETVRLADRVVVVDRGTNGSSFVRVCLFPADHQANVHNPAYVAGLTQNFQKTYHMSDL